MINFEKEIIDELSATFSHRFQASPFVLLIGGFQGSGKSTLIEKIKKRISINVISTDVIRQSLFNRGINLSPEFSTHVNKIYEGLVKKSLSTHSITVIDANAHSKRIQEMEKFIRENHSNHRMLKVFLNASENMLKGRIKSREPIPGCYQGTEKDLEATLSSTKINFEEYDLKIDTDRKNKDEVYQIVSDFLSPYVNLDDDKLKVKIFKIMPKPMVNALLVVALAIFINKFY